MPRCHWPHLAVALALVACSSDSDTGTGPDAPVETLEPEPPGAPAGVLEGPVKVSLECFGDNAPPPPESTTIELTGYVRTLNDPTALDEPPATTVTAYTIDGTKLDDGASDPGKHGRAQVTVPITDKGWRGHVVLSAEGFLDYSFRTNRPVNGAEPKYVTHAYGAFAWLITQEDVDTWASALGVTQSPDNGILIGAVHDCEPTGVANVVIQVNGSTDGVHYVDGPWLDEDTTDCYTPRACSRPFAAAPELTFTNITGRFVVPNFSPGTAEVKAFGRFEEGGPLSLLAAIETQVVAGQITAVGLEPRMGAE